jgi:HTH-type transcriptional regulator/antitoxin HigA
MIAELMDELPSNLFSGLFSPAQVLKMLLKHHAWTQEELVIITGRSRGIITGILAGRVGITAETAAAFGAAFRNDPADWLKLEGIYRLSLLEDDHAAIEKRAYQFRRAPVRDMQRRGWIRETDDPNELEAELDRFFGGSAENDRPFQVATLRSDPGADLSPAERAWCYRARQLAAKAPLIAAFDEERLSVAERKLRQVAAYPKEIERLAENLAYFGIRFVVVEGLPGAKIDGAAFWIHDTPVIAVSVRWDRIDAFWFTVMHEFMHIKNRDVLSVDVNMVDQRDQVISITSRRDLAEQRANEGAADLLVPQRELDSFIKRVSPLYSTTRIVQFANKVKMHPGVIIGQLQHRGEIRYSALRAYLVKVRQYLTETALTDGWGHSLGPLHDHA